MMPVAQMLPLAPSFGNWNKRKLDAAELSGLSKTKRRDKIVDLTEDD